ncbi:hypothetical protein [Herbaspirillum sp. ST 5-3]|uniref:hypothetical protein n=1 Tax=Oxalobacteraceae TaxID=75682 RepID=UPI0010A3CD91|nr:hypothetical protein [Herbaspirillum sp. ST 5-3]
MSTIVIHDLAKSEDLDRQAMFAVRGGIATGGNSWLAGLGPVANVNVGVNQNITQLQNIGVNVLNNVGSIGAGFIPPDLKISPTQFATANAAI